MPRNDAQFKTGKTKAPMIIVTWSGVFWIALFGSLFVSAVIWAARYLLTSR